MSASSMTASLARATCEPRGRPKGPSLQQEVSWALEVEDVEITSDRVTVHYIDVDGLDAVATWEASTEP